MELVQFCWYGLLYYWHENDFPEENECLARFLGIAHNVGSSICYYILLLQLKIGETIILS